MKDLKKVVFGKMCPARDINGNAYKDDNFRQTFKGLRVSVFIYDTEDPDRKFIHIRNERLGKGLKTYVKSVILDGSKLTCITDNSIYSLTDCRLCADYE